MKPLRSKISLTGSYNYAGVCCILNCFCIHSAWIYFHRDSRQNSLGPFKNDPSIMMAMYILTH